MKLWKRVLETRIRKDTLVVENQFGYMLRRSTTAIHILRCVLEKFRERSMDLTIVFEGRRFRGLF